MKTDRRESKARHGNQSLLAKYTDCEREDKGPERLERKRDREKGGETHALGERVFCSNKKDTMSKMPGILSKTNSI